MKLHWVSMAYIPSHPHDSNNQGAISHHPRLGLWLRGGSWHYQVDQTRIHPKTPIPSYSYCEIRHHVARRWIFSCHPGPTKKILSTEIPRAQGEKNRLRQRDYGFSMDTLSRFVLYWGAKLSHVNCVEIDSCLQIPIYSTSQEVTNFSGFPFTMLSAVGLMDFQHFWRSRISCCRMPKWDMIQLGTSSFHQWKLDFQTGKIKVAGRFPRVSPVKLG